MFLRRILGSNKNALFIDGPNLLRSEFDVDLEDIRRSVNRWGKIHYSAAYLNHRAPESLIEAVETNGMEPVITSSDVDVSLSVDAVSHACNNHNIAIATRDADFKPVLAKANEKGCKTMVIGVKEGFSAALESVADEVVFI